MDMVKKLLTQRDDIFTVKGFFSKEECRHYIEKCEAVGFGEAPINAYGSAVIISSTVERLC